MREVAVGGFEDFRDFMREHYALFLRTANNIIAGKERVVYPYHFYEPIIPETGRPSHGRALRRYVHFRDRDDLMSVATYVHGIFKIKTPEKP